MPNPTARIFPSTISLLILSILPVWLHAQDKPRFPLSVEFGVVLASTTFNSYQHGHTPTGPAYLSHDPANYRLGLYLSPNPHWQIGLSVMTNTSMLETPYYESDLEGKQITDFAGNSLTYSSSLEGLYLEDYYFSLQARRQLLSFQGFELTGIVGIALMRTNFSRYDFHSYEFYRDFDCCTSGEYYQKTIPGLEGGLALRYRLPNGTGLFVNGSYLQGLQVAEPEAQENLRYASLEAGVSIGMSDPVSSTRRNTIMLGIGYPSSISYERLLVEQGKFRHSLRAFGKAYILLDDFLGAAYNLKFGTSKHFLLGEIGLSTWNWGEAGSPFLRVGYEFRAFKGLVLRADVGTLPYEYFKSNPTPSFQFHIGYAI